MKQCLPHCEILPDNSTKRPLLFLSYMGYDLQSSNSEEIYSVHLRKHSASAITRTCKWCN